MMLSIMDDLKEFTNDINKFISENANNPWFWIIIFVVMLVIGVAAISKLADK